MEKVIFIHGMQAPVSACFGLGVKASLDKLNIKYYEPIFTTHPDITFENWTATMDQYKSLIDDDTILVCHSLGTNFAIRYLAGNKLKCKALVAVAGGVPKEKKEVSDKIAYLSAFIPDADEFEYCKKNIGNRYNIFNEKDHIWTMEQLKRYTTMLDAKGLELNYGGHFGRSSGVKDLPEVTQIITQEFSNDKDIQNQKQ